MRGKAIDAEIGTAWKDRRLAEVARLARRRGGRPLGPRRRRYRIPARRRLTKGEMKQYLSVPAVDGGLGGVPIEMKEILEEVETLRKTAPANPGSLDLIEMVNDDLQGLRSQVKVAKNGKVCRLGRSRSSSGTCCSGPTDAASGADSGTARKFTTLGSSKQLKPYSCPSEGVAFRRAGGIYPTSGSSRSRGRTTTTR